MFNYIKNSYYQLLTKEEQLILNYSLLMLGMGFLLITVNQLFIGYRGNNYLPMIWLAFFPLMVALLALGGYFRKEVPRLAAFTRFYTIYYFVTVCMSIFLDGIQFTFLPTIDHTLGAWDKILGIDTPALIAWSAHHPDWKTIFELTYSCISLELFFLPLILSLFRNQRLMYEFLLVIIISMIIGGLIYYIWPTGAPVSIFSSSHFLLGEHNTYLKFYEIHHFLAPTTSEGGMIAFPSFHIVYAILALYVLRQNLWLFIPFLFINILGMVATVMLGWHYLIDVFGGIVLTSISILIMHCILNRVESHRRPGI